MPADSRLLIAVLSLAASSTFADVYLSEGTNISIDTAADGRLVTDLLGSIWIVPPGGGDTESLGNVVNAASRPRWSPDGEALVYQSNDADGTTLWLHDIDNSESAALSAGAHADRDADWHPDGERIVFSSARGEGGFDLFEIDLETRLSWRLTHFPGDETEAAWSMDGRDLAYVHEHDGQWSLMLRRHGLPDEAVVTSATRLAAPAWRPDGSLLTYLKDGDDGWSIWMTILAEPRLHRPLIDDEDFFLAPVAWLDRQRMLYVANGHIRQRRFNSWTSFDVPFRARVRQTNGFGSTNPAPRELAEITAPKSRTVIRAGRLFDGISDDYRQRADILIDGGRIVAIEDHAAREDRITIDLGDVTVLPGLIDAYAALPASADTSLGPLLLALGVTTIVIDDPRADELNEIWSGKEVPGPRALRSSRIDASHDAGSLPWLITVGGDLTAGAAGRTEVLRWQQQGVAVLADSWQVGLGSGATLLLASGNRPSSPAGRRYQDVQLANGAGEITFVSGLADAMTPGVADIWRSRPAMLIERRRDLPRRFATLPDLSVAASSVVLGSRPNGLPPGIAAHAELRALIAAGLTQTQALKSAGVNSALALGFGLRIGRIAAGAAADLVIVDGDPLAHIDDTLRIVGVVRNGRFYSVSGLVERAANDAGRVTVE